MKETSEKYHSYFIKIKNMKGVIGGLFMMLVLSSFAFAASSEIAADFTVNVPSGEVSKYVPTESVSSNYLGYIVLAFIVLAFFYFASKKKKKSPKRKRKAKKKRVSRAKK